MVEPEKNPKMDSTKQNYRDLNHKWTIVIFQWSVKSYADNYYGYFLTKSVSSNIFLQQGKSKDQANQKGYFHFMFL